MERRTKVLLSSLAAAGVTIIADIMLTPGYADAPPPTPIVRTVEATIVSPSPTARLSELTRGTPAPLYIEYKTGSPVPKYK